MEELYDKNPQQSRQEHHTVIVQEVPNKRKVGLHPRLHPRIIIILGYETAIKRDIH